MARKTYIGVDNVAHEVKKMYIGVDNIARKVKRAYIGDENGLAKLIYSTSSSYNIRYVWESDDIFETAVAGDTIRFAFQYDNAFGPPVAIAESAVNGFIYFRTGELQPEEEKDDWCELHDYEFSFTMPPDDINVYILTDDIGKYKVQSCSYQSNIGSGISIESYPSTNYVEVGTNMSMSFYCRYSGNVTLTLTNANTGAIYETKTFKNFRGTKVYSFLMPFSDVNIQLTYEGTDLVRYIYYVSDDEWTEGGLPCDVDLSYLPGIPTSAQIGEDVDLTPWFKDSSAGYTVVSIDWSDDYYNADLGAWVVGDGQGDLTFNMPSESIYVVTTGVPYIEWGNPDDWDCDIDGHDWVETAYYPPTCVMIGERYYECSVCGAEMMEEIDTVADHVWGADGKCTECGIKKP